MRDIYQVLRQKELDIERIRKEIDALQAVIPLISEESERGEKEHRTTASTLLQARRTSGAD